MAKRRCRTWIWPAVAQPDGVAKLVLARVLGVDQAQARAAALEPRPTKTDETPSAGRPPTLARTAYVGRFAQPLLGAATVRVQDDALLLEIVDHRGLSCTLTPRDADTYDCAWQDATLGTSIVTFDTKAKRATALRLQIRPEFVDPLEYRFLRR